MPDNDLDPLKPNSPDDNPPSRDRYLGVAIWGGVLVMVAVAFAGLSLMIAIPIMFVALLTLAAISYRWKGRVMARYSAMKRREKSDDRLKPSA